MACARCSQTTPLSLRPTLKAAPRATTLQSRSARKCCACWTSGSCRASQTWSWWMRTRTRRRGGRSAWSAKQRSAACRWSAWWRSARNARLRSGPRATRASAKPRGSTLCAKLLRETRARTTSAHARKSFAETSPSRTRRSPWTSILRSGAASGSTRSPCAVRSTSAALAAAAAAHHLQSSTLALLRAQRMELLMQSAILQRVSVFQMSCLL
mmetsp:Transcript_12414/g.33491  ORF Transcript_12414/g.33491 Transcript_12414/m.33491 type:complete len:212 (+) Transcript_12414:406-1041(+)